MIVVAVLVAWAIVDRCWPWDFTGKRKVVVLRRGKRWWEV